MTALPFRMFSRLFISTIIVFLPKQFSQACGFWSSPGTYRFWLLQPDITREPDLSPFYFASSYLYEGNARPAKEVHLELNIQEWLDVTSRSILKGDIDSAMYHMSPDSVLHHWKTLAANNSFLKWLDHPVNREFKTYFLLSKETEEIAGNPDPWGEAVFPLPSVSTAIRNLELLYKNTHSAFLKTRSAYQMIRLYHYSSNFQKLKETYNNKLLPLRSDSWVAAAATFLLARQSRPEEANLLLSQCFATGKFQRATCILLLSTSHLKESLALAKNDEERSGILVLYAMQMPGRMLPILKEIQSLHPKNNWMPFLVAREINKLEDWLLTTSFADYETPASTDLQWSYDETYSEHVVASKKNRSADLSYASQLDEFIHSLNKREGQHITLWPIYRAHLAWVVGKPEQSLAIISTIKASKDIPVQQKTQLRIMRYLLSLEDGWTLRNEQTFMALVKANNKSFGVHDAEKMKQQLILYTARKLMRSGNNASGLLLLSKTNRSFGASGTGWDYKGIYEEMSDKANADDYAQMICLMQKKNKSAFERFITDKRIPYPEENGYWANEEYYDTLSTYRLMNLQSSWYLRQHKLPEALKALEPIPDTMWNHWPESYYVGCDPVFLNIYHPHRNDSLEERNMDKKETIREMIRLETLAQTHPQRAAEYYFQLANCWYNMGYHGKNWIFTKTWWRCDELDLYETAPRIKKTAFHDDYYGCKQASIYYAMAMNRARDKDLRAFAYFMVRHCHRNMAEYRMNTSEGAQLSATAIRKIQRVNPRVSVDTALVGTLIRECETYKSFVQKFCKPL